MLGLRKTSGERGDTIVEVMVVLALLGMAVGIAFATANTSLLTVQGAQDNTQADAFLQQQVEGLRAVDVTAPGSIFPALATKHFCIDTSVNPAVASSFFSGSLKNYGIYPAACIQGLYHLAISYDSTTSTFTFTAYWDDVQGQGQDSATLVYRMYQ